jgi:CHAP domain
VRATSRKHWAIPGKTPAVQAAGVWLASAALLTCAFSWSPQPAGAATSAALAAGPAPAVRLVVGLVVQRHLLRLFAAYRHIPLASIAAAASGQVLGGRMQRDGRQWAMVHWQPSARAGQAGVAGFQDGGGTGVFTRPPGGAWTVAGLGGQPAGCAVRIPAAVRRLWHLSGCPAAEGPPVPRLRGTGVGGVTGAVVKVALAQVGIADNPPATSFSSPDCNPYTTLAGNPLGASSRHCSTSSNGSYFHNVQDVSEFWCADFTKWVWKKAGVTGGLGTLTPAAASFYTWGTGHGQHISFGGAPKAGDAVILYPPGTKVPNGSYADHVGIVTAVHSDGTVSLVNGDFLGPSNIAVRYIAHAHLSAWASRVEGNQGEKWALVSPLR